MNYYTPILDISRYQYPLNPVKMREAGVKLVYLRCTVGNYYTDTRFIEFWNLLKSEGFLVGVYHVNTPEYSVQSQLDRLFGPLGLNGRIPDVPIVLDCELTRGQSKATITNNIMGCLDGIEDLDERVPTVYTRATWWNPNVYPSSQFNKYPLMVARYSALATHPWNDDPVNLKPHSFDEWALWQWSADGNWQGENYGVGSAHVDLNRGNAETFEGTLARLGVGIIPPPEPIGAYKLQYKAKFNLNVRTGPDTTYPIIGTLQKDTIITAQEIHPTDANSVWAKFDGSKWVAVVHNNGGPYVEFYASLPIPPAQDVLYVQTAIQTNLRWYNLTNGQGKPIMSVPPVSNRPQFSAGKVIAVKPGVVDADGQEDYYEVLSGNMATPPTYVPPQGYTGWYIRKSDVFTVTA